MRVVVVQQDKTVKVEEQPAPKPTDNEILLKVLCAGLNPGDNYAIDTCKPGDYLGSDFVGEVVELGSAVPQDQVKKGEIRWGFIRGGITTKGAFADYVTADWDLVSVVPPNIKPKQAASFPVPLMTALQSFYLPSLLGLPEPPVQDPSNEWILIWSGATGVGSMAIQLAKLSGLKVATTASPKRWELLKSYGADVIVDYKDPDVVKKLKDATGDSIKYGLDCISSGDTFKQAQLAFRPEGGRLITTLFGFKDLPRPEVKTTGTFVFTLLGEDQPLGTLQFKTDSFQRNLHARWAKKFTQLLSEGKLRPLELQVSGGLEDVQKGLELMRANKHDCRLVYNVAK